MSCDMMLGSQGRQVVKLGVVALETQTTQRSETIPSDWWASRDQVAQAETEVTEVLRLG